MSRKAMPSLAAGFFVFVLPGLLVSGCQGPSNVPLEAVLGVDGAHTTYATFLSYLEQNEGEDVEMLGSEVLSALLDQYLREEVLLRWGLEQKLLEEPQERRAALNLVLNGVADLIPEPASWEVALYFDQHRDELSQPERVELRQILVDTEDLATSARERWESGEAFEELAREISQDPTAPFGGQQGVFRHQDLSPEVAEVVFVLAEGEVSPVTRMPSGFHLFQVVRRLPGGTPDLSRLEGEIRSLLRQTALEDELARLVAEGTERYNARIYEENLPFEYRGDFLENKN